jgi:hypothetical protein
VEAGCLELRCSWRAPPLRLLVVLFGPRVFWVLWLLHGALWMVVGGLFGYVCGLEVCLSGGENLTFGRLG